MRQELAALWERSTESSEQLLARLQDWCHRAEASGIAPLARSRTSCAGTRNLGSLLQAWFLRPGNFCTLVWEGVVGQVVSIGESAEQKAVRLIESGNTLEDGGRLAEALAAYDAAIALCPALARAHTNRGNALTAQGKFDSALEAYAKPVARRQKKPAGRRAFSLSRGVVFVSGDLRSHPVGYFLNGALANVDPSSIEVFLYTTFGLQDDLTEVLRGRAASWTSIANMDDATAAERIHADAPHILFDLSGHTAHNRLPVFAYKPAPVQ